MASPSISRVARKSFQATGAEGGEYLQERITTFTRLMLILLAGYFAFVLVARTIWGEIVPDTDRPGFLMGVAAVVAMGGMWLYVRGRPRPAAALLCLDVFSLVDPTILMALDAYLVRGVRVTPFAAVVGACLMLFARALIVPSSGKRTLVVSALGTLPVVVLTAVIEATEPELLLLPRGLTLSIVTFWCAGAVYIAAHGSAVIYGLREKVREARQLGQYTLVEKIGEGGMGSVYRARHAMLRRPTAIKLLQPSKAGDKQLERFEREVQHTAELTHPNTVQIYDYGRSPDGVFYYAMELLDGVDLETLVDEFGAQPPARVVHIVAQVAGALTEAHERGLVHRDVKPANVFLCQRGGVSDVVKVLDFGLVKELARDAGVTDTELVAGTPAFLAPEAITAPDQLGPAADLYALGAVAYYLLAGKQVFTGATVVEVCGHHVHTAPKPFDASLAIPTELEALVLRCLAKKPADRPASARELGRALASLGTSWTERDAERWWIDSREALDEKRSKQSDERTFLPTMDVDLTARAGHHASGSR